MDEKVLEQWKKTNKILEELDIRRVIWFSS